MNSSLINLLATLGILGIGFGLFITVVGVLLFCWSSLFRKCVSLHLQVLMKV